MTKQKNRCAISPTREENYSDWYQSVLKEADLAEHSSVRGCMVIKPWGFSLWENTQKILDRAFKKTGHQNAYFPLFIPLSLMEKEAQHIEGFAKECAIVTHHRLEKGKDGKLVPAGELEEPLIVRPTSEMIIGQTFSKWIKSYRDLPLLINQWANIVRWEMRTRLFLRTTEILWQEGHTVHATKEEALEEAQKMLRVYSDFCHNFLALPVVEGRKTESEKFPGADETYTIEAMMQDGKALQAGTSHFLGQNFAKSCDIQFQTKEGDLEYGWMSSWGVTTRLIGALVMTHADDDGLVLPPRIASAHIVLIPILHKQETQEKILSFCKELKERLETLSYQKEPLKVILDDREMRSGEKTWGWIKKGIPLRLEVGLREIEEGSLFVSRRDLPHKEKIPFVEQQIPDLLDQMQTSLLEKAKKFQENHSSFVATKEQFYQFFEGEKGGFAHAFWSEDREEEEKIKQDLGVTVRCVPLALSEQKGSCIFTGKTGCSKAIFARAY